MNVPGRMHFDADVIVVGLGAMGSSTAWRLAERGVRVLGIERFSPGHVQGSSHGHSRVFRVACLESPHLVTMAQRSRELWLELSEVTGRRIFDQTGILTIGSPDGTIIRDTLAAAAGHDLPIERLAFSDLARYAPGHENIPGDWEGIWDPEGGMVRPEAGVIAAVEAATEAGAEILTDTRVVDIRLVEGGAEVETSTRTFRAPQVVVTTGAWLGKLVPGLPVRPLRVPMTWFAPKDPADSRFGLGEFPVFIRETLDGRTSYWGHGAADGHDAKIGLDWDDSFRWTDADAIDRSVSRRDWQGVSDVVSEGIPGLDPEPSRTTTCVVTHSPDGQFLLGRPGRDPRLIVGGGDSGHAFKHATGIGELLAQIAVGEEPYLDPAFVDPDRFKPGEEHTYRGVHLPAPATHP